MNPAHPLRFTEILLLLLAITACTEPLPRPEDFTDLRTRAELEQRFGPPSRHQEMTRQGAFIMGPIEDFWQRLEDGDRLEILAYRVEGGTLEFYFVNGSEEIGGRAFAPAGVVY